MARHITPVPKTSTLEYYRVLRVIRQCFSNGDKTFESSCTVFPPWPSRLFTPALSGIKLWTIQRMYRGHSTHSYQILLTETARTVLPSFSTPKHQHLDIKQRIPPVCRNRLSAGCCTVMHNCVHTTRISWIIWRGFHSDQNEHSSQDTTNCPPSEQKGRWHTLTVQYGCYVISLTVTYWYSYASDVLCEIWGSHSSITLTEAVKLLTLTFP
jgi:hypothetical protein